MWVEEEVEATVEFPHGLAFPRLRAIRFREELVEFHGSFRLDRTPTGVVYRTAAGSGEYTIRFEPAQQRWVLEVVRDAPVRS